VSAKAAVTNMQTSLKIESIAKIPESIAKKSHAVSLKRPEDLRRPVSFEVLIAHLAISGIVRRY
jgi:hypothetical protein